MEDFIKREDVIQALNDCIDIKGYAYSSLHNAIMEIPSVEVIPERIAVGAIKEYSNGMVAMTHETFDEYHSIAINDAIRKGFWEKLP